MRRELCARTVHMCMQHMIVASAALGPYNKLLQRVRDASHHSPIAEPIGIQYGVIDELELDMLILLVRDLACIVSQGAHPHRTDKPHRLPGIF